MSPKPWRFSCAIDTLPRKSSCGDDGSLLETVPSKVLEESDKISSSDCVTPALPCKYCSKQFKTKNSLSSHTSLHHGEERQKTEKKSMTGISRDINRNLLLLESLSDSSGHLLNADIITREIFKTGVQPEKIDQEENFLAQPEEIDQEENILPDKLTSIRPVKRKSFPKPVKLKMSKYFQLPHSPRKSAKLVQSPTNVSKHFPSSTSPPTPPPPPPTSTIATLPPTKCASCSRKCTLAAGDELPCCSRCKEDQARLLRAAAKSSKRKQQQQRLKDVEKNLKLDTYASSIDESSDVVLTAPKLVDQVLELHETLGWGLTSTVSLSHSQLEESSSVSKEFSNYVDVDVYVVQRSFVKYAEPESIIIDVLVNYNATNTKSENIFNVDGLPDCPVLATPIVSGKMAAPTKPVVSPSQVPDDESRSMVASPDTRHGLKVTRGKVSVTLQCSGLSKLEDMERLNQNYQLIKIIEVSTPVAILSSIEQSDSTHNLYYPISSVSSSSVPPISSPSSHFTTRPKRSCSSKMECPSCGQLSLLLVHDFCCDSCVAAQEQLLRIKRRKTVG